MPTAYARASQPTCPPLSETTAICAAAVMFTIRHGVPYRGCGARRAAGSTPSSTSRVTPSSAPDRALRAALAIISTAPATTAAVINPFRNEGPASASVRPTTGVSRNASRTPSGTMASTRNPSNPVTASEKTATMTAVRFRFRIRGCSSSGAICDSVSTPPMTNITEPRARMALNGDAGVPGVNGSGAIVPPWRARVMSAQAIANTSTEQAPMTAREMASVENIRPRRCPSHTTASSPTATATAVFSAAAGDICGARPARNSPSRTARPQRRRGIPGAAAPPAGPTPPPAREIRPVPASPGRTCRHGRTARRPRRRRPIRATTAPAKMPAAACWDGLQVVSRTQRQREPER